MSTHQIKVIRVNEIIEHPNADALEIVPIGGWRCVVRKGDYKVGDLAVYVEPDYVVDVTRGEFAFLDKGKGTPYRVRAKRLRGVVSYGLLIPADSFHTEGDDVMAYYGIVRYEPPVKCGQAANIESREHWPDVCHDKFDLENLQHVVGMFDSVREVVITEKIHGANARYVWQGDKLHIGSRTQWLKVGQNTWWHRAVETCPWIEELCKAMPGMVLYGEVFGDVQSLKYGCRMGEVKFAVFAARMPSGTWVDTLPLFKLVGAYNGSFAPILYKGAFDQAVIETLAEQDSTVEGAPSGHMREGVVIVPSCERLSIDGHNRIAAKFISTRYWESGK